MSFSETVDVSPTSPVLMLPELLGIIFAHLIDEDGALCNVVCVNSRWFDCGTEVLWKKPAPRALENVSLARRQLYASKINHLNIQKDEFGYMHALSSGLCLPRLRGVSLDIDRLKEQAEFERYIPPHLEVLDIRGVWLDTGLLSRIGIRCGALREIKIAPPPVEIPPEMFIDFLKACPSITRVSICSNSYHDPPFFTNEVWLYLATRPNLTYLCFNDNLHEQIDRQIRERTSRPFPALRGIRGPMNCGSIIQLAPLLPHLITLSVQVGYSGFDFLPSLKHLSNLRTLVVRTTRYAHISVAEITSIKVLVSLRELSIICRIQSDVFDFDDGHLEHLVSSAPNLRVLCLSFQSKVRGALGIIFKHCRNIRVIKLHCTIDLLPPNLADQDEVMFPKLEFLCLEGFAEHSNEATEPIPQIVRRMRTQMPSLRILYLFRGDELNRDIKAEWGNAAESVVVDEADS